MAENEFNKDSLTQKEEQPQVVSKEEYDKLYQQAVILETRYTKLFEVYKNLLDLYLAQK